MARHYPKSELRKLIIQRTSTKYRLAGEGGVATISRQGRAQDRGD